MTGIKPEAARPPDPIRGLPQDVSGQVGHSAALRALGMQMLVVGMAGSRWPRRIDEVVRREAAVQMHVSQHAGGSEALERPVDGGAMDRRLAAGDLVDQRVSRQVVTARGDDPGQQRDARLGDALPHRTEQVGGLSRQNLPGLAGLRPRGCHPSSLHPPQLGGYLLLVVVVGGGAQVEVEPDVKGVEQAGGARRIAHCERDQSRLHALGVTGPVSLADQELKLGSCQIGHGCATAIEATSGSIRRGPSVCCFGELGLIDDLCSSCP